MMGNLSSGKDLSFSLVAAEQQKLHIRNFQKIAQQPGRALIVQLGEAVIQDDWNANLLARFDTEQVKQFQAHYEINQICGSVAQRGNLNKPPTLLVFQADSEILVDNRFFVTAV